MEDTEQPALSGNARATLAFIRSIVIWLLGTIVITTVVTNVIFGEEPLGSNSSPLAKWLAFASTWVFTGPGMLIAGLLFGTAASISFVQQLMKYDVLQQRRSRRGVREGETIRSIADVIEVVSLPKLPAHTSEHDSRNSRSVMSEAAATIASIMIRQFTQTPLRIVVTGAQPAEGKSTIALALGRAFARMNRNTLLIDCDLRAPSQAAIHRHPPAPGLSDMIYGLDMGQCIRKDSAGTGLSYIAAGHVPPSAPLVLDAANRIQLWEKLSVDRDFVILDCPPVMALADAVILSASADIVVVVIEADRTKIVDIRRTLQRAVPTGKPILAVLNKVPDEWGDVFYGYGYEAHGSGGDGQGTAPTLERDTAGRC